MGQTEENLEKLRSVVKAGPEYIEKNPELGKRYVTDHVVPALRKASQDLCIQIDRCHCLSESQDGKDEFVIHYTSIGTLMSMLQNAAKNKQGAKENDQSPSKNAQNAALRLYDSVHFNDPDEGNYLYRHLNLPDWLDEKKKSHAYIASFILPNNEKEEKDMSDNLVFWRTYGKDGEGCSLKLSIPMSQLRQVFYGVAKMKYIEKELQPLLNSLGPLVNIPEPSIKKDIQEELAKPIWESLTKIRYLYKSTAYEYESECRFVIPELDTEKDRIVFEENQQSDNSASPRHYYEHDDLDDLKVEKMFVTDSVITLGPCVSNYYNLTYYIKSLLRNAGLEGPKIKISEINYRKS